MADTEYRLAVPEDWSSYRGVRLRALRDSPEAFSSSWVRESVFPPRVWRARLAGAHTVLALRSGAIVGTATGIPDRRDPAGREVVAVWVDPDARGEGLATALLHRLVEWARAEGSARLVLWVADGNAAAARAYARAGFAPTGERTTLPDGRGEELWSRATSDL